MDKIKKLGVIELVIALILGALSVYSVISAIAYKLNAAVLTINILALLGVFVMLLAAITMLRGKNDRLTVVIVILLAIFELSIPFLVLLIMLLIKRKPNKSESIAKVWFIPVIVEAVMFVYNVATSTSILITIIGSALYMVQMVIFSLWLLKYLVTKSNDQTITKNKTIDYYKDLLDKGSITQSEYDEYVSNIEKEYGESKQ